MRINYVWIIWIRTITLGLSGRFVAAANLFPSIRNVNHIPRTPQAASAVWAYGGDVIIKPPLSLRHIGAMRINYAGIIWIRTFTLGLSGRFLAAANLWIHWVWQCSTPT